MSRRAKLIYQIEDAKRLRQYRKDRGKDVQRIVSKYFEGKTHNLIKFENLIRVLRLLAQVWIFPADEGVPNRGAGGTWWQIAILRGNPEGVIIHLNCVIFCKLTQ